MEKVLIHAASSQLGKTGRDSLVEGSPHVSNMYGTNCGVTLRCDRNIYGVWRRLSFWVQVLNQPQLSLEQTYDHVFSITAWLPALNVVQTVTAPKSELKLLLFFFSLASAVLPSRAERSGSESNRGWFQVAG